MNVCQTNRVHSLKSIERMKERDSWLDLQSGGYQLANIPGCAYASLVVHMFQIRSRNLALLAQLRRTGISIYLSWSLLSHVSWAGHIFHISGTYLDSGRPHNSAPKHIYQPSNVHLECSSKNLCMVAFLSRFHQPTCSWTRRGTCFCCVQFITRQRTSDTKAIVEQMLLYGSKMVNMSLPVSKNHSQLSHFLSYHLGSGVNSISIKSYRSGKWSELFFSININHLGILLLNLVPCLCLRRRLSQQTCWTHFNWVMLTFPKSKSGLRLD